MNLFFLKHEKKVYLDLKEALLIRREENILILRRLCTDFQKRRKCTKFEKLMYIFLIKKKNLRRREEFKKKMYIPVNSMIFSLGILMPSFFSIVYFLLVRGCMLPKLDEIYDFVPS